ncbi:DUF6682 family protein [Chromobacterium phragmitis]|uniref:Uncharacterized protein n=1 Tax=Chromobacterium phragmitis TaxID=2202141 RepID=A0A344UPI7_9NEIS|nr:DUF6682 family protein [Chromobacterium phragmitis]AXE37185.1 hypothetical protein DK843_22820 [Chromobacterium phragmitis]
MKAKIILDRAGVLLVDQTNINWPRPELLGWLNDGQREVVIHRPDSCTRNEDMALVAGTKQQLPAAALKLIEVVRNSDGHAITPTARRTLDANKRDWHVMAASSTILHYVFDLRDPQRFYVYPPAAAGTKVEVIYSTAPKDCESEDADLGISEVYANVLTDYVLYRAFSKPGEAGSPAAAASYYQTFTNALSGKTAVDQMFAPGQQPGQGQ